MVRLWRCVCLEFDSSQSLAQAEKQRPTHPHSAHTYTHRTTYTNHICTIYTTYNDNNKSSMHTCKYNPKKYLDTASVNPPTYPQLSSCTPAPSFPSACKPATQAHLPPHKMSVILLRLQICTHRNRNCNRKNILFSLPISYPAAQLAAATVAPRRETGRGYTMLYDRYRQFGNCLGLEFLLASNQTKRRKGWGGVVKIYDRNGGQPQRERGRRGGGHGGRGGRDQACLHAWCLCLEVGLYARLLALVACLSPPPGGYWIYDIYLDMHAFITALQTGWWWWWCWCCCSW